MKPQMFTYISVTYIIIYEIKDCARIDFSRNREAYVNILNCSYSRLKAFRLFI